MNIKTFLWLCQEFFEQINPNIYDDKEEINDETINDINKDYLYLCELYKNIISFINPLRIKLD
jgi:hypothetical protein